VVLILLMFSKIRLSSLATNLLIGRKRRAVEVDTLLLEMMLNLMTRITMFAPGSSALSVLRLTTKRTSLAAITIRIGSVPSARASASAQDA
jgi:hypothetical protein